jgi:hypothetical protein
VYRQTASWHLAGQVACPYGATSTNAPAENAGAAELSATPDQVRTLIAPASKHCADILANAAAASDCRVLYCVQQRSALANRRIGMYGCNLPIVLSALQVSLQVSVVEQNATAAPQPVLHQRLRRPQRHHLRKTQLDRMSLQSKHPADHPPPASACLCAHRFQCQHQIAGK